MLVERIKWKRVLEGGPRCLPEGRPVRVQVGGNALCLVRNGGQVHALLDRCPHQGSSFMGGWCEGPDLVCPRHRMGFNLQTGRSRAGGAGTAEVFPVEERADGIYVGFAYVTVRLFGVDLW